MRGPPAFTIASWCALLLATSVLALGAVETGNGQIVGHRSSNAGDVWEYLGIPYAQPPLGDLRFAGPQKYSGIGVYNASKFG
jgi:cholinesterase